MYRLVDKTINRFIDQGIVPREDKEIYTYGLQQGLIIIINILTYILISLYFKMLWESLVFLVAYILLRTYAGGYHARTQTRCYFLSILMIFLVLMAIKVIYWTRPIIVGLTILSGSTIFILAPVEDSNKPLSDSEERAFRKITRIILAAEGIIIAILLQMGYLKFVLPIALGMGTAGLMVSLGKVNAWNTGDK